MRRLIPFLLLLLLATSSGLMAGAAYHQSRTTSPAFVVNACNGKEEVRPSQFMVACADGNQYLTKMHWYAWGQVTAYATALEVWNGCTPTCVAGTFHTRTVTVWAQNLHGEIYQTLTVSQPFH